jgi:outer membrane protein TolC
MRSLLLLLLLLPTTVQAQALTEDALVAAALRQAPEVQAIAQRTRAVMALGQQYVGLPDPSLRLTVTGIAPMFRMPPTAMLMAEQAFPLGDARAAGRQVADAQARAIAAEQPLAEAELAWQARTVFAAWRSAHARQKILQHHVKMGDELIAAMTRQMATGGVTAARLARLQTDVERLRVDRDVLTRAMANLGKEVQLWLGETPLADPVLALPEAPTQGQALDAGHPVLARLTAQEVAAQARVTAANASSALTLMPGLGVMTGPDMPIGFLVTVGLRWPGFGKGRDRIAGQVESARADGEALAAEKRSKTRRISAAMAQAWTTMEQVHMQRQGLHGRVLPLAERAVHAAMPAVASGTGTAIELIEAEHRLVELELQLVALDDAWMTARARWLWLRDGDPEGQAMSPSGAAALPNPTVPEPTPGGMPGM